MEGTYALETYLHLDPMLNGTIHDNDVIEGVKNKGQLILKRLRLINQLLITSAENNDWILCLDIIQCFRRYQYEYFIWAHMNMTLDNMDPQHVLSSSSLVTIQSESRWVFNHMGLTC